MQDLTRRRFLGGTAAGAAGLWVATNLGARWVGAASVDPEPFRYGVASGDPLADRVIIWTHVSAAGTVGVVWQVASTPDFTDIVRSGISEAGADTDHTVKVDVDGLDPGTTYWYRFQALGATSRPGRTRTAPAYGGEQLTFAVASCQNFTAGYYAAWGHIAERDDLDFVMHVGDYIYEGGGGGVRDHDPAHEILTLTDYRDRYRNYRSDAALRAAHAAHPFIATWDDHEVANNNWREGAQNHQPDEGDYIERRNNAYRAYEEWMPIRLPGDRDQTGMRIHRDLAFGDLAHLIMLDTRQYRDEELASPLPVPGPQTNPEISDPDRTYLGPEQKAWLKERLSSSTARWRIIGNQAMLAQFTYGPWPDEVSGPLQELTGMPQDGFAVNPDQWDGYQAEQREMLAYLRDEEISNVVVCTGDIHMSFANEVYVDAGKFRVEAPVAAEFVGPSVSSNNFDESVGWPPRSGSIGLETAIKAGNPHIRYCELDSNGYMVLRATPDHVVGEWYHLSDVRDPNAGETLATAWRVSDGDLRMDWVGGQPLAT